MCHLKGYEKFSELIYEYDSYIMRFKCNEGSFFRVSKHIRHRVISIRNRDMSIAF